MKFKSILTVLMTTAMIISCGDQSSKESTDMVDVLGTINDANSVSAGAVASAPKFIMTRSWVDENNNPIANVPVEQREVSVSGDSLINQNYAAIFDEGAAVESGLENTDSLSGTPAHFGRTGRRTPVRSFLFGTNNRYPTPLRNGPTGNYSFNGGYNGNSIGCQRYGTLTNNCNQNVIYRTPTIAHQGASVNYYPLDHQRVFYNQNNVKRRCVYQLNTVSYSQVQSTYASWNNDYASYGESYPQASYYEHTPTYAAEVPYQVTQSPVQSAPVYDQGYNPVQSVPVYSKHLDVQPQTQGPILNTPAQSQVYGKAKNVVRTPVQSPAQSQVYGKAKNVVRTPVQSPVQSRVFGKSRKGSYGKSKGQQVIHAPVQKNNGVW